MEGFNTHIRYAKPLLSLLVLLLGSFLQAQTKINGEILVNAGISRSDMYFKVFDMGLNGEKGRLYPQSQKFARFFDFNLNFFLKTKNAHLKPVLGFGYCPTGFNEEGLTPGDSSKIDVYKLAAKMNYYSVYAGLCYELKLNQHLKLKFIQTLNPMYNSDKIIPIMRKAGLAERSSICLDMKLKNGNQFAASVFFQSALIKFNKSVVAAQGPNYLPFSFGFNLGAYLNTN